MTLETTFDKFIAVAVTGLVAIATATSDKIVGKAKDALNRSDTRQRKFDSITDTLSTYVYTAENVLDVIASGKANKDALKTVVDPYNDAYTALRKAEYSNAVTVDRLWNADAAMKYRDALGLIRAFDQKQIHPLNDAVIPIYTGEKPGAVVADAKQIEAAKQSLDPLKQRVEALTAALAEPPSPLWKVWR